MKDYTETANGLINAVHWAKSDKQAAETINAAIQRAVTEAKQEFKKNLISAINDTSVDDLDHSTVRIVVMGLE